MKLQNRFSNEKIIMIELIKATEMGRPLYIKYGFVKMNDEMELPS